MPATADGRYTAAASPRSKSGLVYTWPRRRRRRRRMRRREEEEEVVEEVELRVGVVSCTRKRRKAREEKEKSSTKGVV
jgi:hypothetical protein